MHLAKKAPIAAVIGLVLGLVLLAPSVTQGSEFDLRTVFSVNHPITVPNAVLEPNTNYVISVGKPEQGMRNVVRIYKGDESQLVTQFLAINKERPEPADETILNFMETAAGFPQPVESWFYPGRKIGLEFLYSKDQMADIALHMRGVAQPTQTAAVITESEPAELPRVEDEAVLEEQPVEPAPAIEESASNQTYTDDESDYTDSQVVAPSEPTQIAQNELPRTAGELPLLALIGSLATSFGFAVRSYRR